MNQFPRPRSQTSPSAHPLPPLRWALLRHNHPWLHWDLLVERRETPAAATWRLLRKPCCNEPIAAEPLPDHRLEYLDYEGPVSGNRGVVKRLDRGIWHDVHPPADSVFASDAATTEYPSTLLQLQFSESLSLSKATLIATADGRLFWIFDTVDNKGIRESDTPLVQATNS